VAPTDGVLDAAGACAVDRARPACGVAAVEMPPDVAALALPGNGVIPEADGAPRPLGPFPSPTGTFPISLASA
jgi:hypothetical protein